MPIEPIFVRVETISTSSSKTLPSGVRTSTGNFVFAMRGYLRVAALVDGFLGLLDGGLGLVKRLARLRELVVGLGVVRVVVGVVALVLVVLVVVVVGVVLGHGLALDVLGGLRLGVRVGVVLVFVIGI